MISPELKTEPEVNGVLGQTTTLTCTISDTQSAPNSKYWIFNSEFYFIFHVALCMYLKIINSDYITVFCSFIGMFDITRFLKKSKASLTAWNKEMNFYVIRYYRTPHPLPHNPHFRLLLTHYFPQAMRTLCPRHQTTCRQ